MKNAYMIVVALTAAMVLTSCGTKKDIDTVDMAAALSESITFSEQLTELDGAAAENYFMLNPNDYNEMSVYISTKACGDELAVIKTDSPKTVAEKLTDHVNKLLEDYAVFRPTETEKIENAVINTYKDTVVFMIAPDMDEAQAAYKAYLKN
ncbi:MAG: DUF4358 domain-containing protein [Clostridia bacterium]|nr:DUF4358 domain-containing protein [Clostridia bacterium]